MSQDNPSSTRQAEEQKAETLQTLVNAIYEGVRRAQVEVQSGAEKKLDWFFPENAQTRQREPRLVHLPIPDADGRMEVRPIPLFALVPHHDLMVDQINIRLKLSLLELLQGYGRNKSPKADIAARLSMAGDDREWAAEVEIKLRGIEPVEGISRLNDTILKRF